MFNALTFSQSEENIKKIKEVLIPKKYNVLVVSEFIKLDKLNKDLKNTKIIIIDISNLDGLDKKATYYVNFLKKINQPGIINILILNKSQAELIKDYSNLITRFNDLIFDKNIVDELAVRINFNFTKFKIFSPENYIIYNNLVLNKNKYEITIEGVPIELTFKEYELLKLLLENPDKVFTRVKIFSLIWGFDFFGGSRTVDVHIRRIRMKLTPEYSYMIKTIRNVGYMFSPALNEKLT